MDRRTLGAALLVAAGLTMGACGGGSPNAAGGAAGEEMQEAAEADGYPDVELEAGGGSVTDTTGADYTGAATGAVGGGSER